MRGKVTTKGPTVEKVIIRKIRGVSFVNEDGKEVELKPSKINIITGSNGSLKTLFLEALSTALLHYSRSPNNVVGLLPTLRMDDSWLYYLVSEEVSMTVNDLTLSNANSEEVLKLLLPTSFGHPLRYSGLKVTGPSGEETLIAYYSMVTSTGNSNSVQVSRKGRSREIDFVAYSTPNPMNSLFYGNFLSCVSPGLAKGKEEIKRVLGLDFIGYVPDELGRNQIALLDEREKMLYLPMLGGGISSMVLLLLASSLDVVVYDNVENHLHKTLMVKLIEIMRASRAQWFVTTQSLEFLEFLDEGKDIQVWQFKRFREKDEVLVRVHRGEEIGEYINELGIDLRG
ncbi:MAG: hypothetical protein QXS59_09370 [Metallosphaera sp.]